MAAPAPRSYFVITVRGELGPFTRVELGEQAQTGAVRLDDRVRNAFGRSLGTVADALSDAASSRSPAYGLSPVADPPPRRTRPRRRTSAPLIIALVAGALVVALVAFANAAPPPTPAPADTVTTTPIPVPPSLPVARRDSLLPTGWNSLDLGDARPKHTVAVADGVWVIAGGGSDLWGTSDQCAFAHQGVRGDSSIQVRVVRMEETDYWDKAGVMLRPSLDAAGPMAAVIVTHRGELQFLRREDHGGEAMADGGPVVALPVWVRLKRRGSDLTAAWSQDGQNWSPLGQAHQLPALTGPGQAGLVVCSHNRSETNRTVFDGLAIIPSP